MITLLTIIILMLISLYNTAQRIVSQLKLYKHIARP